MLLFFKKLYRLAYVVFETKLPLHTRKPGIEVVVKLDGIYAKNVTEPTRHEMLFVAILFEVNVLTGSSLIFIIQRVNILYMHIKRDFLA